MYFYIFEKSEIYKETTIIFVPEAPMIGAAITHVASVILSFTPQHNFFTVIKNRFGLISTSNPMPNKVIDKLAAKYLGIRLFDDGFFVSDKDLTLFLLKFNGLAVRKELDNPII